MASGLAVLASAAIIALACFTARGFVAMTNYTDMAPASRMALDKMAQSIRQPDQNLHLLSSRYIAQRQRNVVTGSIERSG